jgi:hypothetical protein
MAPAARVCYFAPTTYSVTCARCGTLVLTSGFITNTDLAPMLGHLRERHADVLSSAEPPLDEILAQFRIAAVKDPA